MMPPARRKVTSQEGNFTGRFPVVRGGNGWAAQDSNL
jgi:hypothetical protein